MAYISIGGLHKGGVLPDHPNYDLPPHVFNDVENMSFTPNGVRPMVKEVEIFPGVLNNPLLISKVKIGAVESAWVYLSAEKMNVVYNGVHYDITRIAGDGGDYVASTDRRWQEAILNGIPIYNNGIDIPQSLDPRSPTANAENLANWPENLQVRRLEPFGSFLIGLGISTQDGIFDEQGMLWSDPADAGSVPPSWDFTDPATQAGLYTFSETDDRIVGGLALGDEFIVYKERSIYAMRFIGGTFVFSIKRRRGDIGLLTADAVTNYPGGHFFVGQDDLYVYSGNGLPQSVANGRVRRKFFSEVASGQKAKVFTVHDAAQKSIYVFYPQAGDLFCTRALIWRYDIDVFTFRDVPEVSSATFGAVTTQTQQSWDDSSDVWGGEYGLTWEEAQTLWATDANNWESNADTSPWDSDTTVWDDVSAWDEALRSQVWDLTEFEPIVENLVMASYISTPPTFDPVTNTSTSGTVSWSGDEPYPPFWLVPDEGVRFSGKLMKKGLAIIGKDHMGNMEVSRTAEKILTEFYPELEYGEINIRFGVQDSPDGEIFWDDYLTIDVEDGLKVDPFISGKFLAFEICGSGDEGKDWLISGYGMEVNLGGRY